MSDITPADALRELGDDQAEYAAAAAKKLGLPESVEYVEMRTEYAVRYMTDSGKPHVQWRDLSRELCEALAKDYAKAGMGGRVVVREVITTAWREVKTDD